MKLKKYLSSLFLVSMLNHMGIMITMDQPENALKPIDRILLNACKNDKPIERLIEMGANINAIENEENKYEGCIPLHYACFNINEYHVRLLLKKGAKVNHRSALGLTPAYMLFVKIDKQDENKSKRLDILKLLIENGADVTTKGPNNTTLLSFAIMTDNFESAQLLLDMNKIDVRDLSDDLKQQIITHILRAQKNDLLLQLVNAGFNPILNQRTKVTIMHLAAIKSNVDIINGLARRVSVNAVDAAGQTPLFYAAEDADLNTIQTLLDLGANVLIEDSDKKTAVQLSKKNKDKRVYLFLKKAEKKALAEKKAEKRNAPKLLEKKEEEVKVLKKPKKVVPQKGPMPSKAEKELKPKETVSEYPEELIIETDVIETPQKIAPPVLETPLETPSSPQRIPETKTVKPKKAKLSLTSYAQEKARKVLTTEKNRPLTYKAAVGITHAKPIRDLTIKDSPDVEIIVPVDQEAQVRMLEGNQENPLVNVKISERVEKKKNNPDDLYHNFSTRVEGQLGTLAKAEVLEEPTKKHSAKVKYTIPASMILFDRRSVLGNFEFIIRDGEMLHRFFKPKKSSDEQFGKKEKALLLPEPSQPQPEPSQKR
jgi:ankyrin repeat protein